MIDTMIDLLASKSVQTRSAWQDKITGRQVADVYVEV